MSRRVVDIVMAVAGLIESQRDRIVELEINPLMVKAQNHGAVVADALIRVRSLKMLASLKN